MPGSPTASSMTETQTIFSFKVSLVKLGKEEGALEGTTLGALLGTALGL